MANEGILVREEEKKADNANSTVIQILENDNQHRESISELE